MADLPPPTFSGKNLGDFAAFLEVQSYSVNEWAPGRDGRGKPEALVLQFDLGKELDGVALGIRLKSRAEVDRLVAMLVRRRDSVWPADIIRRGC